MVQDFRDLVEEGTVVQDFRDLIEEGTVVQDFEVLLKTNYSIPHTSHTTKYNLIYFLFI